MKLDLHLGAHKTATTHFQSVMEANRRLYEKNAYYVSLDEFRNNVTKANKLLNLNVCNEVDGYLKRIRAIKKQKLIISEENIIGEAKDIYNTECIYTNASKRLCRLKSFVSSFEDVNIWISIRSMDTFLPSIYCESLLHWDFRSFSQVLLANYNQSWLPLIHLIKQTYPEAKVNVICYEDYADVLPSWLEALTGEKDGWNLLEEVRPRRSLNHLAINVMKYSRLCVPYSYPPKTLRKMSAFLYSKQVSKKFSPFNKSVISDLRDGYERDIEAIERLRGNVSIFRS